MLGSITRGAVLASFVAVILALPRSVALPTALWTALMALALAALPAGAALWPRRPDVVAFDTALAGVGLACIGLLALSPNASGWLYAGVPLGYALYAFVATLGYVGLARWRTALRIRAFARLRSEARARHRTSAAIG